MTLISRNAGIVSPEIYKDGTYISRNPDWHEADSFWKAAQIIKMLNRNRISPSTIGEVGCGAGEILSCLTKELGDRTVCHGYDVSPQAIEICRKKQKHNLHFHLGDVLESPGPHFDVLLAIDVMEHIEDYFTFLRKMRPKGKHKLFHIPLDISVQAVLRGSPIMNARSKVGHIHYFTKETALAVLRDTGYEVVDYFYTCGSLDLPNRGWKASLLKLPRKLLFSMHEDLTVRTLGGFSLLALTR